MYKINEVIHSDLLINLIPIFFFTIKTYKKKIQIEEQKYLIKQIF